MEVIVHDRGAAQRRIALRGESPITMGRGPTQTIVLGDPRVSRQHAVFETAQGAWFVRDAGSANGTFVNSIKLRRSAIGLRPGDVITFGDSRADVVETGQDTPPDPVSANDTATASAVELAEVLATIQGSAAERRRDVLAKARAAIEGVDPAVAAVHLAEIAAEAFGADPVAFFLFNGEGPVQPVVSAPDEEAWASLGGLAEAAARTGIARLRRRPILRGLRRDDGSTHDILPFEAFAMAVPAGTVVLALDGLRPTPLDARAELALGFALAAAVAGTIVQASRLVPQHVPDDLPPDQTLTSRAPLRALHPSEWHAPATER